ncbi:MAG TPA: hypothetical protein VGK40_05110, partial [Verrucomicrobiae bacterium]
MFKFPMRDGVIRVGLAVCLAVGLILCGCANPRAPLFSSERHFTFDQDTFVFANELVWRYDTDPQTGETTHTRRDSTPNYTHRCFVVVRSARQFFQHARFDATLPKTDDATYRRLVRRVVSIGPSREMPANEKVVLPGYANLREFSQAHETLLKAECGGIWRSYLQRGHWRMIFPISRSHQDRMARQLADSLGRNRPPVVHLVRFPSLAIDHAALPFDVKETE